MVFFPDSAAWASDPSRRVHRTLGHDLITQKVGSEDGSMAATQALLMEWLDVCYLFFTKGNLLPAPQKSWEPSRRLIMTLDVSSSLGLTWPSFGSFQTPPSGPSWTLGPGSVRAGIVPASPLWLPEPVPQKQHDHCPVPAGFQGVRARLPGVAAYCVREALGVVADVFPSSCATAFHPGAGIESSTGNSEKPARKI